MEFPSSLGKLISVQAGKATRRVLPDGKPLRTGLYKLPVEGPVWAGSTNLDGDSQGDLRYHGGPDKAICCFPIEHFDATSEFVEQPMTPGAFGENLTFSGMLERDVCIGDQLEIGDALFEVTQPRQPCGNLARWWSKPKLVAFMVDHGFSGFYMRVLREGLVEYPATVRLVARPNPRWTIEACNNLMYHDRKNRQLLEEAVQLPQLSEAWREGYQKALRTAK